MLYALYAGVEQASFHLPLTAAHIERCTAKHSKNEITKQGRRTHNLTQGLSISTYHKDATTDGG